jgi:hypothetical protein
MQYNVFGPKHRSNVQGNEEIVEVGNKHGNGDKFPDFVDLFFLVDRKHTLFFLGLTIIKLKLDFNDKINILFLFSNMWN